MRLCTWQPWLACTAPCQPQESLVRDEPRISRPAISSLTRTTLGQLCVAPQTSQSRPAAPEPGREPRVSGGTASAAIQCPRPLWEALNGHILVIVFISTKEYAIFFTFRERADQGVENVDIARCSLSEEQAVDALLLAKVSITRGN